ncbi:MAG: hypothetical protein H0V66_03325 [Bdellovibrionales bacterium]|nr:hypothetical protein [Bdellovibrionales bacterium]
MKTLLVAAVLCSSSAFAVDSAKIEKNFKIICNYTKSCESHTDLAGRSASSLLQSLGIKLEGDLISLADLEDRSPGADGIDYGQLTLKGALMMVDDFVEMETVSVKQAKVIKAQLSDLKDSGVVFGYTPNQGGVVCGVVFPSLLLIDTDKSDVHSIAMLGYPEC